VAFRTVDQKPHGDDFAKARELIEVRGTGALSLHDRRVMNVLYANAGAQLCDDVEHVIAISELRGLHKGGERVKDSILRLMKTVVEMPTKDRKGRPSVKLVPVLSDTTVSDDDDNPSGQVIYSFSPGMRAIIKDSTLWGRVRTAVVFAFTSKYSLALYELITARINLTHVWQEDFSVQDLRELLGVPDGKLVRVPNLIQKVIRPAEIEVNGLADFGVRIEPIRTGGTMRGLVTGFKVAWHRKDIPGLKEAYSELHRSKVGRIARLSGKVETVRPLGELSAEQRAADEELGRLLTNMRETERKRASRTAG
jgi:Initiator Replication protein